VTNAVLKAEDVNGLGLAVMALSRELWVVKDRLKTLESYMESKGMLPPVAIDTHQLNEQQSSEMQRDLDRFVDGLAAQMTAHKSG